MKEDKAFLTVIEQKCQEISDNFGNTGDELKILSLASLPSIVNIAKKLEECAESCTNCRLLKYDLEEYLNTLEKLLSGKTFIDVDSTEVRKLYFQKLRTIENHLMSHGYKLRGTFKTRFLVGSLFLGLILWILAPAWHFLLSFVVVVVGYLVGYSLDKKYDKKGLFLN